MKRVTVNYCYYSDYSWVQDTYYTSDELSQKCSQKKRLWKKKTDWNKLGIES